MWRRVPLDDVSRTSKLAASDLKALRTVANWIWSFVAMPNKDIGRDRARVSLSASSLGT